MATSKRRLQIRLLSRSGELVQSVECHSGQLSVFRAVVPRNLEPFERALRGIPGPEKFSIQLDGAEFDPAEHLFIGFGESFQHANERVDDFIASYGVDPIGFRSVLLPYELNDIGGRSLNSLTACEERRLRLLLATYTPTQEVMVLRNPFEPLAERWREPFAELLLDTTRIQARVIVVTSLMTRPQCWIQNELVARLQVDETTQRTIGFSNAPSDMQEMIHELRAMMQSGAIPAPSSSGIPTRRDSGALTHAAPPSEARVSSRSSVESVASTQVRAPLSVRESLAQLCAPRYRRPLGIAVGGAATLVLALLVTRSSPELSPPPVKRAATVSRERTVAKSVPPAQPQVAPVGETTANLTPQEPPAVQVVTAPPPPAPKTALDEYPRDVRAAVLAAFSRGSGVSRSQPMGRGIVSEPSQTSPSAETPTNSNFVNLLNSLSSDESSPSVAAAEPATNPFNFPMGSPETTPENEEARREQIRQKFLEAIQRAAQNQGGRPEL